MDASRRVIGTGSIGIDNDTIAFVCATGAEPVEWRQAETWDLAGKVVIPGLVNAHTHAAMTFLRGYADDMALMEWLEKKIWPFEAHLTPDDVYTGTLVACAEMIRSGTTVFADMYFHMDDAARAVAESGMRASLSRGLIGTSPSADADEALREAVQFCERWQGDANGRITTCLAPHAPYTCPPPFLQKVVEAASAHDLSIHTHISETRDEIAQIARTYGESPVKYMMRCGVFKRPTLAAHCVLIDDDDIDILSDNAVAVAHNPGSNMKLASGVAPVIKMRDRGVVVGLGTDGASSNNNLDLIEEARLAALLHKVVLFDPTAIAAMDALAMATIEGAKALRMDDQIGSLETGKQADLVVLWTRRPHMAPLFDPVSNIVYSSNPGDIEHVFVRGEPLMRDGKIVAFDENRAIEEFRSRSERLAREAKS
jgi:5-methylthioadenosine/S-adenosylhomocysteine deaminase